MKSNNEISQEQYYRSTAGDYDEMHLSKKDEHYFALAFMVGMLDFLNVKSILDVGSGTGRALSFLKEKRPDIKIVGIEPIHELREIGHTKGLSEDELIDGNALKMGFEANSFDLVCEFGVLHHVEYPNRIVSEMLRVANKAVFLSDNNIYGDGSLFIRTIKQLFHFLGLYRMAYYIQTNGKLFTESEADGIAYHYSVYDSYKKIDKSCSSIHLLNTNIWTPFSGDLYRTASHIALLGILKS